MKLQRGAIPLYYQIAQILRSQILSQEYKPKDTLPTEEELVRTLGVSRTTVRQALQRLMHEGLIYRIPGKGTFVAPDPVSRHGDWSVESIDEIITAGSVAKIKFLGAKSLRAGEGLAKSLRIRPGAEVTQFRKLQFVDDEPFFHITLHVPRDLAAKVPLERIEERPVFLLLEECCNLRILEAHQWMAASLASNEVARHLKLKVGDPVLLVERHFIDSTGRVVEIATDHYRTDRMRHFLRLTRRGGPGAPLVSRGEVGGAEAGSLTRVLE